MLIGAMNLLGGPAEIVQPRDIVIVPLFGDPLEDIPHRALYPARFHPPPPPIRGLTRWKSKK